MLKMQDLEVEEAAMGEAPLDDAHVGASVGQRRRIGPTTRGTRFAQAKALKVINVKVSLTPGSDCTD